VRTIAIALFALALPTAAQAGFSSEPMPAGAAYRPGPINGGSAEDFGEPRPAARHVERPGARDRLSRGDGYFDRQLARARDDIDRRRERGELSRSEARQLRRQLGRIRETASWYGRDGFSSAERGALELRASELRNRTATGRTS